MSLVQSTELFTAINLFIIGLSHLCQPKSWAAFFIFLHSKQHVGNIINALIALGMGSIILSFHFVWYWPQILITIYGTIQLIKGIIYLIKPSIGISSIKKVTMENTNKFRWAGLVAIILSFAFMYILFTEK